MDWPGTKQPRTPPDPLTEQARTAARQLRKYLQRKGIRVAGETTDAWSVSTKKLISVHGAELVDKVIAWYGPQCDDPYLPQVRSGSTLLSKFDRLLERSGLGMTTATAPPAIVSLLDREPLAWPMQRRKDPDESEWAYDAYTAITEDLLALTQREQNLLGPPRHVLRTWRRRKNLEAFRVGRYNSFNDVRYRPGDDHTLRQMLWELTR